jgi:hypothetical protein
VSIYRKSLVSQEWELDAQLFPTDYLEAYEDDYPVHPVPSSLAMNPDGSVLVVGVPHDNNFTGAAWVFYYNAQSETWVQAQKCIGAGSGPESRQGQAVVLSETATVIGSSSPDAYQGSGAVWTWHWDADSQAWIPDAPLVGSTNQALGASLALSPDASLLAVGSPLALNSIGQVYIYSHDSETTSWIQPINTLPISPSNAVGGAEFGRSLTAGIDPVSGHWLLIVGGPSDNYGRGSFWTYDSSDQTWIRGKVSLPEMGAANLGSRLSLSSDTSRLVVSAPAYQAGVGGWVSFTVGTAEGGETSWDTDAQVAQVSGWTWNPKQGSALALSRDGTCLMVGAPAEDWYQGRAWILTTA